MLRSSRDGELEAEQVEDRAEQTFGMAQRRAERGPQRQRGQDRQRRVVRLATRRGRRRRAPSRDRRLGEPDREAAALTQGGVIRTPVRHPVLLLGDVMTASDMSLERHGGRLGIVEGAALLPRSEPGRHRADPCHNAVVRDYMHLELARNGSIDGLQKAAELDGAVPAVAATDHLAHRHIQSCEEG
jgi:hypothetical protein